MKWRLFVAIAGVLTLVLLGQDLPLSRYWRASEHDRVVASLERDAFILAGSAEAVLSGDPGATVGNVESTISLYARRAGGRVIVVDAAGRLVASSDGTAVGTDFSSRPEITTALAGHPAEGSRPSQTAGTDLAYVAVPVLDGATTVGALRITFPRSVIDDRVGRLVRGLLLVFVISLVAALAAALLMASQLTMPLARLRRRTEILAAGDFTVRADDRSGPKEVRALAASFNTMTERIDELVSRQRSFAGDASHQLRSPLTALRLQLEQAAASVDDTERDHRLDAAIGETERLQRLVDGLLLLARSDATSVPVVEVGLDEVVGERLDTWASLGEERGIAVTGDIEPGVVVLAVPNAVEQMLDNYLDNALAVSAAGGTIEVRVRRRGDRAELHVLDRGPGIRPEYLRRAFDRFWRAPDAAHRGSGIGLAVVHQLALASGGRAEVRNRTDGPGLDASVSLRLAPAEPPAAATTGGGADR